MPEAARERPERTNGSASPAIAIRDLHKSFGEHEVLRGIDLEIAAGEVVCIIGPSGSGKSTLLRCMNLLERPTNGTVYLFDDEITARAANLPAIRRRVGMVFQQFNLFPHMSALRNVMEGPVTVLGTGRAEARAKARALLAKVGVDEDRHDLKPGRLSGGQQQRIAIARALALDPEVMLFDEPTSALDPELVAEVLDTMRQLAEEGMTMVIVTHEMAFAKRVADRIAFIDGGRIVELGDARQVLSNPQSERLQQFLNLLYWGDNE
ncbi:MAG: amino acid ABC transporter ATP-binding protein [Chloroflexota bacterium]|nr:amino acid ABC transporter ATP-binding protein [Chloroflexota bacterium]